jgi:hypothetical protein
MNKKKTSPYPMLNSVDKFGIKEFYPTKYNGLKWYADWDKTRIIKGNIFDQLDSRFGVTTGTGTDQGLYVGDGKAKLKALDSSPRLFVKGPWLNTEQTVYIKILDTGKASGIQLRSRSNHHGVQDLPYPDMGVDPATGKKEISCGFGNYEAQWATTYCTIELEIIHGLYNRDLPKVPFTMPKEKYIGFKTATRTLKNGNVKFEVYNNMDTTSQSNWQKVLEFTFNGTNAALTESNLQEHKAYLDYCINRGDKISGDSNNHQIWNKPSYWNWIRINNAENIDLKYYSVREIQ